jgi:serine/threonine protein kinase
MIGQNLSHYRITEKLGAGGMGEVYKARDERLGRDVAVKVLRKDLATDAERLRRFEQEARAASALNHPNIITIHDIGKHEGTPYIAMEFVEGKTLRELVSEGPLHTDKLHRFGTQIAEGLAKAHSAGIIHRDLKPENLMVTSDGYVKILDFGLAKLLPQPGVDSEGATITKEGTVAGAVMGTASYMSPEQALGKPLDARTDIFSLGAVLYEMATGKKPFSGETTAALFDQILHKAVAPPSSLNPALPRHFDKIVGRALEKDTGQRYPSVYEVLQDLAAVDQGALSAQQPEKRSIVVLPFEDISPGRDNEYFSDGLTEEIISDLSNIETLRVISRTSSMMLKDTKKDIKTIGKELDVQYVLEGSVRKAGNAIRVTAQLIDTKTDAHLWAKKYSGTLEDVFDIQEKVSRSIVDALKLKLSPEEEEKIAERPIENVQAYDCYNQARLEIWRSTEESLDRATRLIKNGLNIIGDNELLYASLGIAYIHYMEMAYRTDEYQLLKAEECADKVFELNPRSSYGHILKGRIHFKRWNVQGAVREIERALATDPNNVDGILMLPFLYAISGRTSAAKVPLEKLKAIDPLSPWPHGMTGWVELFDGQFESAARSFTTMHQMEPENSLYRYLCSMALAANGQVAEACSLVDLISKDTPRIHVAGLGTFMKHAWRGEADAALAALSPAWIEAARFDETFSWHVAAGYGLIGKREEALDWLENSINRGVINYPFFTDYCPWFENIRDEDRFKKLMERVKHEWENFEV